MSIRSPSCGARSGPLSLRNGEVEISEELTPSPFLECALVSGCVGQPQIGHDHAIRPRLGCPQLDQQEAQAKIDFQLDPFCEPKAQAERSRYSLRCSYEQDR